MRRGSFTTRTADAFHKIMSKTRNWRGTSIYRSENVYRRFLKGYANRLYPIKDIVRSHEQDRTFESMKKAMSSTPVFGKPRWRKEFCSIHRCISFYVGRNVRTGRSTSGIVRTVYKR